MSVLDASGSTMARVEVLSSSPKAQSPGMHLDL